MRRFLFFIPGLILGAVLCQSVFATTYLINDGGRTYACTLYPGTTREALAAAGVELHPQDGYTREKDTITVRRAPMVEFYYHGERRFIPIGRETAGEFLERQGIALGPGDRLSCPQETPLSPGMELRVDLVESREETFVREIPYATQVCAAPDLPQGMTQTLAQGKNGTLTCRAWVTYANGVEESREILEQRQTAGPVTEIIAQGCGPKGERTQGLVIGDGVISLPTGERLTYTKVDYVRATAYTHTDEGCTTTTATGTTVRRGTVAVDPRYIPYGTRMFIVASDGSFQYGLAQAEDCGGDIKGDRMDLYFPTYEECITFGRRRCTVYFLG